MGEDETSSHWLQQHAGNHVSHHVRISPQSSDVSNRVNYENEIFRFFHLSNHPPLEVPSSLFALLSTPKSLFLQRTLDSQSPQLLNQYKALVSEDMIAATVATVDDVLKQSSEVLSSGKRQGQRKRKRSNSLRGTIDLHWFQLS